MLEEIAAHMTRVIADGTWTPRIDRSPHYEGAIPELGQATTSLAL
jgi:peptidoglycan-N-acetylglucosamine deacetylase